MQQLHSEASEARSQLTQLVKAHDQLRAETDKRVAAAKQAAAGEREALQARHAAKVKKLQEAAKDQAGVGVYVCLSRWQLYESEHVLAVGLCGDMPADWHRSVIKP